MRQVTNLMSQIIVEIPLELSHFQFPPAVQNRLHELLDRQDSGQSLTVAEQEEAEGLVELSEFLSLLHLRSQTVHRMD
jgi:hypothetical protein